MPGPLSHLGVRDSRRMAIAALWLALALAGFRQISDYDIWYHAVVGREVWRRFAVPAEEFYVLLLKGQPGEYFEWGFGLVYYLAHRLGGPVAMSLLNAVISATVILLATRAGCRRDAVAVPLVVAVAVLWWMDFRLVFRPESFLFLAVAAELYLLERWLADPRRIWLAPLPLLAWLLAQCHPSPIFLFYVLGGYGLQRLVSGPAPERGRVVATMAVTGLAMAAAAALNPFGVMQVLRPLLLTGQGDLLETTVEFLPALSTPKRDAFLLLAVCALAGLAAPRRRLVDALMVLAFGLLAYRYVRNIGLFALMAAIPMTRGLDWLTGRLPRRTGPALAVAAVAAIPVLPMVRSLDYGRWGGGIQDGVFPVQGAALMAERAPPGNLLNFFHLGSFLRWRLDQRYPVFVDGRNFSVNVAIRTHDDLFNALPGWQARLRQLEINAILTPATLPYSGELIPLVAVLAHDPDWVLAAAEPASLTFLRRSAVPEAAPLPEAALWSQAVAETIATLADNPAATAARQTQALARAKLRGLGSP